MKKSLEKFFEPVLPVNFMYKGEKKTFETSGADTQANDYKTHKETVYSYLVDENLLVKIIVNDFDFFDAAEWRIILENPGSYNSDIVSGLNTADLHFPANLADAPVLYHAEGSFALNTDFRPNKTELFPSWPGSDFRADGGRSTSERFPYYSLDLKTECYIIAIGWSGQWRSSFRPHNGIAFTAGMEFLNMRLFPGEIFELPSMTILHNNSGDRIDAHNKFRQLMVERNTPRIGGKPLDGLVGMSTWGGYGAAYHAKTLERVKKYGFEIDYFWIDAGWHNTLDHPTAEGGEGDDWYKTVGDWKANPHTYPNGMEEIGELCKDAGTGLLLWIEPERAVGESKAAAENPGFYLGNRIPGATLMLNLGCEPARIWIRDKLAKIIKDFQLRVLRIDFNYAPLPYWRYNDKEDRQGVSEIRYIRGLYKTLDELLQKFPELIVDNCASGGRRLDYELLRRTIPLFRTDYTCFENNDPVGCQNHTYGLAYWIPVNAISNWAAHKGATDTYRFRSSLSAGIAMSHPGEDLDETRIEWTKKMIAQAKAVRPYMKGNFYPLTGYSFDEKDWQAIQMHMPGEDKGVIIAFRRKESFTPTMCFGLSETDAGCDYVFEDVDTGVKTAVSGKDLQNGYCLTIPEKRGSKIIFYSKV